MSNKSQSSSMFSWFIAAIAALVFLACVGCNTQPHSKTSQLLTDKEADSLFVNWFNKTDTARCSTVINMNVTNDYISSFLGGNLKVDTVIVPYDLTVELESECVFESENEPTHYVYLHSVLDVSEFTDLLEKSNENEIFVHDIERFLLYVKLSTLAEKHHQIERFYEGIDLVIQLKSKHGKIQRVIFQHYAG